MNTKQRAELERTDWPEPRGLKRKRGRPRKIASPTDFECPGDPPIQPDRFTAKRRKAKVELARLFLTRPGVTQ